MARSRRALSLIILVAALALSLGMSSVIAQSPVPSPLAGVDPPVVSNETSLPVTVRVNGTVLQVIPPTTQSALAVTGPPPWYIELLAPGGFRLATGYIGGEGPLFYRTDLSCGRIDITWRTVILGPMKGPGQPGDCGPDGGVATSPSPAASPGDGTARARQGDFALTFTLPRTTWQVGEAIEGTAALASTVDHIVRVGGSGDGLLGFEYAELGGPRDIQPFWTLACGPYDLRPGAPITSSLTKTGSWDPNGPDADFYRDFFADPAVRLPAGMWDITAAASFVEGTKCDGAVHDMRATVRIEVVP